MIYEKENICIIRNSSSVNIILVMVDIESGYKKILDEQ